MIFNRFRLGCTYACHQGKHAGKLFIYVDKNKHEYGFVTTPEMQNIWVPKDEFDFAVKNNIIVYVERVPKEVRTVTKAQFNDNKKSI